ncbi:MAG: transcriptional regulator, AraC family [Bacteroidetes bacterium]|jgi:AraC-like DNA-binding protein|nr:transcriptional regulator, AraC family [Bacteroidota bacterium]
MEKILTLEEFYRAKLNFIPENLKKGLGHFNVFSIDECICSKKKPVPYSRKDYFKITLLKGKFRILYADRTLISEKYALIFSNPMIPYSWEPQEDSQAGYFCIFTEDFFSQYGNLKEYPMFKPGYNKVFILTDEQVDEVEKLYHRMFKEINSDFEYKYDVIRGLIFNLIHDALKMQPAETADLPSSNAATRITSMFVELLERQFPIETAVQRLKLRSPVDYSEHLSVHVNHLNRSLKEITGKTTSQLIGERLTQEARMLLRHTNWNISEIGFCLGFDESSHFINFFRKNTNESPKSYRDRMIV